MNNRSLGKKFHDINTEDYKYNDRHVECPKCKGIGKWQNKKSINYIDCPLCFTEKVVPDAIASSYEQSIGR